MSRISWLYPQWAKAFDGLAGELQLDRNQTVKLFTWFEQHVFEVGQDYTITRHYLEEIGKRDIEDFLKYQLKSARVNMIEMAKENNLIHRADFPDHFGGKIFRQTVLVLASPGSVGPGTREKGMNVVSGHNK